MKVKSIITIVALMALGLNALAQEQKGRISPVRVGVAVTAGSNSHLSLNAQSGMLTSYQAMPLSVDWTDKALGLGIEGSLIFCDRWKLDLGGSLSGWNVPPRAMVPGTYSTTPQVADIPSSSEGLDPHSTKGGSSESGSEYVMGEVPTYDAVNMQHKLNYTVYIASSYYFRIQNAPCLRPYLGLRFQASYAAASLREQDFESMGRSTAEAYTLASGVLFGVDYYFGRNFFVGASVEPFRYTYGVVAYRPQEGLSLAAADTHFFGVFAAPQLKIGFLF